MSIVSFSPPDLHHSSPADPAKFMLWIDGVGGYLVCLGKRVTIGGPGRDGQRADVSLLAGLATRHASIVRSREGCLLEAHGPVTVAGRTVIGQSNLSSGCEIHLGDTVRLGFRLPTALSATAALDFVSDHRPAQSIDGVILLEKSCLLGPGPENHIRCRSWEESVVLYRKENEFWCKSRGDLFVGSQPARTGARLAPGELVTGTDLRFHLEAIP